MEEFGFALRVAREKRGLTQTQVMQLTGINNKTLSGYENGVSEPDLQTLATLLRLYHASADRLLRLESRPQAGAFRRMRPSCWPCTAPCRREPGGRSRPCSGPWPSTTGRAPRACLKLAMSRQAPEKICNSMYNQLRACPQ